jgi:hypothetical protein
VDIFSGVTLHVFLISTVGKLSDELYAPSVLIPQKEPLVDPRAGLTLVAKRKILVPAGNHITVVKPIACHFPDI